MKRILLILTTVLCSTQIFAQLEQEGHLFAVGPAKNKPDITFRSHKWIRTLKYGLRKDITCYYYIKDKDDSIYQIPVKETIIYRNENVPIIFIELHPTNAPFKIKRKDKIFDDKYSLIATNNEIDSLKFVLTNPSKTISPFNKEHNLIEGEYTRRDVRNQYIRTMLEYKKARCIYVFANFSPNVSYRRLEAIKPTAEYYEFVEKAQLIDKSVSHARDEWNAGLGYGFGTGNSFTAAYSQFYNYYKTDSDFGKSINWGIFLGYRYQRIHRSHSAQPVIDLSYGIINGSRNDVYKLGLGLSFMLWSKNVYLNTVPYFRSNFRANSAYTGINEIGARPYSFGCDVGLVYKGWLH
jgi:hypothetical protein